MHRIRLGWESQSGVAEGWYWVVEVQTPDGYWDYVMDSQKIASPVDADSYGRDDRQDLLIALTEAYPGANIDVGSE